MTFASGNAVQFDEDLTGADLLEVTSCDVVYG
jgi:hypothetical protein